MRIVSKNFSKPESWQDCKMSMTLEKGVYVDGYMNVFYPKGKLSNKTTFTLYQFTYHFSLQELL